MAINCWEFKKCGKKSNGGKIDKKEICIASTNIKLDGINHGSFGGRTCWAIAGTLCDNKIQGTFAHKIISCIQCDFYKLVIKEEGKNTILAKEIISILEK